MTKPLNILLVEDNPGDADLIQEMLPSTDESGFRVHTVSRLSEAVSHLKKKKADLALLDLDLPDSRGIATIRTAHAADPQLPIVVLTGNQDEHMGIAAVKGGAQDFLVKGQTHRSQLSRVLRYAVERQNAEEKIRESERFLRATLDALAAHIAIIDASGQIITANKAWKTFAGHHGGHVLRCYENTNYFDACQTVQDEQMPDVRFAAKFAEGIRAVLKEEKNVFEMEYSLQSRYGTLWFHGRVTPFPSDTERKVVIAHEDITERILAQKEKMRLAAQLRHAYKMEAIGILAGGIAHDFNNILSSILGYVELSLMDLNQDSQLEKNLKEVYQAGTRAKELVNQILTFARKDESHIQPTQISAISKEATKLIRSIIPSSIEVQLVVESEAFAMAEPAQIHQIFMNLFTNAAQAMEDEGGVLEVKISEDTLDQPLDSMNPTFESGAFLKITVADTGIGICADYIDKIFDPYFTTKGRGEGTGLGLSVVHGIVRSYGGQIGVESTVGRGTTFTIHLPLASPEITAPACNTGHLPQGYESILFVDDELPIADMSRQQLSLLGYKVTAVSRGQEALKKLSLNPDGFDAIITDMTMPEMSGEQLAMEAKKIKPQIPIILCTGYSKNMSKERATAIGIDAFLMKPVAIREMAETLQKVLGHTSD